MRLPARWRAWPWLTLLLPGCASILEGRMQTLHVTTEPPGAACTFTRHGSPIATIERTPSTVRVDRSRDEIALLCQMPGREPVRALLRSEVQLGEAAAIGDYVLLAGPGYAVDSLTGADRRYRSEIKLTFPP